LSSVVLQHTYIYFYILILYILYICTYCVINHNVVNIFKSKVMSKIETVIFYKFGELNGGREIIILFLRHNRTTVGLLAWLIFSTYILIKHATVEIIYIAESRYWISITQICFYCTERVMLSMLWQRNPSKRENWRE